MSRASTTAEAVRDALGAVRRPLTNARLGLLFAAPRYDLREALGLVYREVRCDVIGCTTAGAFTERGVVEDGLVLFVLGGEGFVTATADGQWESDGIDPVVDVAGRAYEAGGKSARKMGLPHAASVVLVDGLSGRGESFVSELLRRTHPFQRLVGGAAGDGVRFERTLVGRNDHVHEKGASIAHLFTKKSVGVGIAHGLVPATEPMVVTRAEGTRIHSIDGKPAFEVYQHFAATRGVRNLTRDNAGAFLIQHEIGIFFLDELREARAPLSVEADGTIVCAASVGQGDKICFLDGTPEGLLAAAKTAASNAKRELEGTRTAGVLVFDCICRAQLMGERFYEEVEAIASVFPGVPVAGFMTYGEIARARGHLQGWHNTTCVVVAIPES